LEEDNWKGAFSVFLEAFAFERAGRSPHYSPAAIRALNKYQKESPAEDFEIFMWNEFSSNIENTNKRNNPIAPSSERSISLTVLISTLQKYNFNIIKWAHEMIEKGCIKSTYNDLCSVRGIGSKITSLFLRDIVIAFNVDESKCERAEYFQPIDRWTRRGSETLSKLFGKEPPKNDKESATRIVEISKNAGVSSALVNTGLWMFGAQFVRSERGFQELLSDPKKMKEYLLRKKKELNAQICFIDQILK